MQNWPVVKEKDIKQSQEFQYPLYWNWNMKANSLKKAISDYRNMFLAASWVGWTESLEPNFVEIAETAAKIWRFFDF